MIEENEILDSELSPEELEAKKKEMLQFYKQSMPYLKAQLSYEQMLFEIDEIRFKRTQIQMQYAMMMNPPEIPDQEEGSDADIDTKKRKLKKT